MMKLMRAESSRTDLSGRQEESSARRPHRRRSLVRTSPVLQEAAI